MKTLLAAALLAFATVSPVLACLKAPDSPSACAATPAPSSSPAAPTNHTTSENTAPKSAPAPRSPTRTAPAALMM